MVTFSESNAASLQLVDDSDMKSPHRRQITGMIQMYRHYLCLFLKAKQQLIRQDYKVYRILSISFYIYLYIYIFLLLFLYVMFSSVSSISLVTPLTLPCSISCAMFQQICFFTYILLIQAFLGNILIFLLSAIDCRFQEDADIRKKYSPTKGSIGIVDGYK